MGFGHMKIVYVRIENWRSIKSVKFSPADVTVLVGSNNAGKTTYEVRSTSYSAIADLCRQTYRIWTTMQEIEPGTSSSRCILITPCIRELTSIHRAQYVLQAFDRSQNVVRGFNNAMREEIAFAYVDAARNFERQFSLSRWSLFGPKPSARFMLHSKMTRQGSRTCATSLMPPTVCSRPIIMDGSKRHFGRPSRINSRQLIMMSDLSSVRLTKQTFTGGYILRS